MFPPTKSVIFVMLACALIWGILGPLILSIWLEGFHLYSVNWEAQVLTIPLIFLETPFVLIHGILFPPGFDHIPFSLYLAFICNGAFWGIVFARLYQWRQNKK
jgi:hypothetical protein